MRKRATLIAVLVAVALAEAVAIFAPSADERRPEGVTPPQRSMQPSGGAPASAPALAAGAAGRGPAPSGSAAFVVRVVASRGGPIEGAEVTIDEDGGSRRIATSDASGEARFVPAPRVGARLTVRAEGFVPLLPDDALLAWRVKDGSTLAILTRLATLAGRVVDATTGRPIAGARVEALEAGELCINPPGRQRVVRSLGATTSDGEGRYRIERVEETWGWCGVRTLRVDAIGCRTRWLVPQATTPDGAIDARMVPGGAIEGRVLDATGRPVAGVRVAACLDGHDVDPTDEADGFRPPQAYVDELHLGNLGSRTSFGVDAFGTLSTESDDAGRYRLAGIGLGETYAVAAFRHATGRSTVAREVRATRADVPVALELRLEVGTRLTVRCTDERGAPRAGVAITLGSAQDRRRTLDRGTTDVGGTVVFAGVRKGSVELSAPDDVRGGRRGPVLDVGDGDLETTWVLPSDADTPAPPPARDPAPPAPDTDEDRRPTPTWRIALALEPGSDVPSRVEIAESSSDSRSHWTLLWEPGPDGRMVVEGQKVGDLTLRIRVEDRVSITRTLDAARDTTVDLGAATVERGLALRGRVLDAQGRPVAGIDVRAEPEAPSDAFSRWKASDADGGFCFGGLRAGAVRLSLDDRRFLPFRKSVDVPRIDPVELRPDPGTVIRVLVVDADGLPVSRAAVTVRDRSTGDGEGESDGWAYGETDLEGIVEVRVRPGTVRLEVREDPHARGHGGRRAELTATVPTADSGPIRVTLPRR